VNGQKERDRAAKALSYTAEIIDRLLDVIARTWIMVTTQRVIARFAPLLSKPKGMSEELSDEAVEAFGDGVQYLVESQISQKTLYFLRTLDLPVYTHDYTIFRWRRKTETIFLRF
jgi:hypothetical protein